MHLNDLIPYRFYTKGTSPFLIFKIVEIISFPKSATKFPK
ncbi:hypothetical protein C943_02656 [Mariniradius saccharolyticus AK6]|uniref:Uncharacterized protein n=1 Tax=Mariniradius saccharolyticus AK6 TaxID=1239962 RepID=M7X8N6_9BACT|nr:hypothetical protein C943_02656 [Mariniradius saccharolyticus AK6]